FRGVRYPAPANSTSLGDLRFGADLRLFGQYGEPITGAIGARVWFPTGDAASYAGDTSVRVEPRLMIAGDAGIVAYAVEAGAMYRAQSQAIGTTDIGSDVRFAASVGVRLAEKKLLLGPEIFGSTVISKSDAVFAKNSTPLEGLLGAHYAVAEEW